MKRFSEQLKKRAETVKLRASEKRELHDRVVAFMEYHPLPSAMLQSKSSSSKVAFESYRLISIPQQYFKVFIGAVALVVVVVVPTVAENTIPGDILYPVKVNVTEEIRSSLSFNSYERVVWETTRLERRISEARLLAQAGLLTPEVEAGVLAAVATHKSETEKQIESLRTTDADGAVLAQMTFATMLGVQSSILKSDDSASTTAGMSTVALSSVLDAGYTEVTQSVGEGAVSIDRMLAQLEIETTRSYELLQSIKSSATELEQSDVSRRLSDVENRIAAVTGETSADSYLIKSELKNAWTDIQKLISFMTDIDVRDSLAIESLVPVVMTKEEKLSLALKQYNQATINLLRLEVGLSKVENVDVANKISLSLPNVSTLLATASTSLYTVVEDAQTASGEALALTESMLSMAAFPDASENTDNTNSTSTQATTTEVIEIQKEEASSTKEKNIE